MNEVPLDELSGERFTELLRTVFQVAAGPSRIVELTLTAISGSRPPGGNRGAPGPGCDGESFALLFEGPGGQPLEQQTYRFTHERLGWFDLFIVPVGAEHGARQYEAVFNRQTRREHPGRPE